MNARIFFEYAYLAIALYCAYEAYQLWNAAQGKPYMYIIFAIAAVAMFWLRRQTRLKQTRKDNLLYIRLTNLVGCILFVIYGYCIMSIPVILPNAFLIIVQIVYIWRSTQKAHKQT